MTRRSSRLVRPPSRLGLEQFEPRQVMSATPLAPPLAPPLPQGFAASVAITPSIVAAVPVAVVPTIPDTLYG